MRVQISILIFFLFMLGAIVLSAAILFGLTQNTGTITITQKPVTLVAPDSSVTIKWQEPLTVSLKFGRQHGQYPNTVSVSGNQSLTFVPREQGMGEAGIYFCILESANTTSEEFSIIIEATRASKMIAPANQAVLNSPTTLFTWDPVPGVPFYHILLSDQEVTLEEDEFGDLQLVDANIIWQAITPATNIQYGVQDPSGFFNQLNGNVPPLVPDQDYNWIVINNYGNNPALSSIVQGGVNGFTVQLNLKVSPPALLLPVDAATIFDDQITFTWSQVSDAVNYMIYLYEEREQSGSISSFPIWNAVTSSTSIDFPTTAILRDTRYYWRVYAFDGAALAQVSERFSFRFNTAYGILEIQTLREENKELPRTNLKFTTLVGSSEPAELLTTESGFLEIRVQPGIYRLTASKQGYVDTTVTTNVTKGQNTRVNIRLREAPSMVTGQVKDQDQNPLSGANVTLVERVSQTRIDTQSDPSGNFGISLKAGDWSVYAQKKGYANSDTLIILVSPGFNVSLFASLIMVKNRNHIRGTVVNQNGKPIFAATVKLSQGRTSIAMQTDMNGFFDLEVGDGTWTLLTVKTGFISPIARQITVNGGQILTVTPNLALSSNAALLSGFISDRNKAIPQVLVKATRSLDGEFQTLTNPQGSYQFNLPSGSYAISVEKTGYTPDSERQVTLSAGQTLSGLNFLMTANPSFIRGKITSAGTSLEGVRVWAGTATDTSHADGTYVLKVLDGSHEVRVEKAGYISPAPMAVTVDVGATAVGVDFELKPNAAKVSGRILSQSKPVVGAEIQAQNGPNIIETISLSEGSFLLNLDGGTWNLSVSKYGFMPVGFSGLSVKPGQTVTGLDFDLTSNSGFVHGDVKDQTGTAIRGATITVVGQSITTVTDVSGSYTLSLEPGTYQLQASKPQVQSLTRSVNITNGGNVTVNFVLQKNALIWGIVTDNGGNPLNEVEVKATGPINASVTTNFSGRYKLFLPTGSYQVTADGVGYQQVELSLSVINGDTITHNFSLNSAPNEIAELHGKVLNSQHGPLANVTLRLTSNEVILHESGNDGSYRLQHLQTGKDYLVEPLTSGRFFLPKKREYRPLRSTQTGQDFLGNLYGDVSANEQISSFDGSLVLRYSARQNISPFFENFVRDSTAADVSGNGTMSAFDASLIFRYSVNLISFFPVELRLPKAVPFEFEDVQITLKWSDSGEREALGLIEVYGSQSLFSTDIELRFDSSKLLVVDIILMGFKPSHQMAYSVKGDRLFISTAGTEPVDLNGPYLKIVFEKFSEVQNTFSNMIWLENILFNEVKIDLSENSAQKGLLPKQFALHQNYPNPFNLSTVIKYDLPVSSHVRIAIYNLLGQLILELVNEKRQAGFFTSIWDGDNNQGQLVASGVYFLRMETRSLDGLQNFVSTNKLALIK